MNRKSGYPFTKIASCISAAVVMFSAHLIFAQTTAFTYQGKLAVDGSPVSGNYDFQFTLWDAVSSGMQLGMSSQSSVAVTAGVFTVTLDFGSSVFPGANRFLEINVRAAGGGAFTPLSPRQPIVSTPYAVLKTARRSWPMCWADRAQASTLPRMSEPRFVLPRSSAPPAV